jgi:hypothetical protein
MTGWFPGEGRNADDEAFLGELRTLALHEGLADVRPEDTTIHSTPEGAEPLILYFRVPGLPPSKADPTLQIGFSWSGSDPFLVGTWEVHGTDARGLRETSIRVVARAAEAACRVARVDGRLPASS